MVCAHRYTRRGLDYRWGQGQCFTLTNRLKFDETEDSPKLGPIVQKHGIGREHRSETKGERNR